MTSDVERYRSLMKESAELAPIVEKYREYQQAKARQEALALLDGGTDPELRELAEQELTDGKAAEERCAEELKTLLLPRDPNDERNVIIEIQGGAGGEESALFAGSLYRMYSMYAASKGFKTEVVGVNETDSAGIRRSALW